MEDNPKNGLVEVWDSVLPATILLGEGWYSVYIDGDLCDGFESMEDFLTQTGGKLYSSLQDYKKDKFFDLRKWIDDLGWKKKPVE